MKAVFIKMTIYMGVIMSLALSLVGTLAGGHFSVPSWLLSFCVSLIISLLIGFIIPVRRISNATCTAMNLKPRSLPELAVSALISDLIYTPIITLVMVTVMLKNAAAHASAGAQIPTVGQVFPGSLAICFIVGYILIVIAQPLLISALMKKHFTNMPPKDAA